MPSPRLFGARPLVWLDKLRRCSVSDRGSLPGAVGRGNDGFEFIDDGVVSRKYYVGEEFRLQGSDAGSGRCEFGVC